MKFGIFVIESLGSTLAEIGETAKAAEEAGFDGLFVGENHFPEEGTPPEKQGAWGLTSAPLVLCMAVAACTTRLRVGTAVLALPLHHAMEVAKQATALDVLSQGRFVLGVGIGMEANGFREYGIPFVNRVSLLEEGVEVMRRAWTEESFSITGRRYRLKDAALNVYPFQKPAIPLWFGARTEAGAKRAARLGGGILLDAATTLQETKDLVGAYRQVCAKRGVKPYVAIMRDVCIGRSAVEARQQYEAAVVGRVRLYWQVEYLNEAYDPWVKEISSEEEVTWELATRNRVIAGNPQECTEEIEQWRREVGCDYLMVEFLLPADGRPRVLEDIRLFGRTVISPQPEPV